MPELIQCPKCDKRLRVPENLMGKKVKCPSCGTAFTAAAASEELPTAPLIEEEPPQSARRKPMRPSSDEDIEETTPQPRRRRPPVPEEDENDDDTPDEDYEEEPRPRRRRRLRRNVAPHRGSTILVLGIVSFFCLTPILGPMAWIMGNTDLREIRAGRMNREGEGLTNAGRICGMISTILICVTCGIYATIFFIGVLGSRR